MRLNEHCYVPRLLVKEAEMKALSEVGSFVSQTTYKGATLYPLLEIPDIGWNFKKGCPSEDPIEFIHRECNQIRNNSSLPAFLDAAAVVTDQSKHKESTALIDAAFSELGDDIEMIPVLHNLETSSEAYRQVQSLIRNDSCSEVCLRFREQKWTDLVDKDSFDSWLRGLGIGERDCHVIIDLESNAGESSYNDVRLELSNMILGLYTELDFVILGTAVPEKLASGVNEVARSEWNNWCRMVAELGGNKYDCPFVFGDYGTVGLNKPIKADPKVLTIYAKFKYALNDSWLLGKGGAYSGQKGVGSEAARPVINAIAKDPRFHSNHCGADTWIKGVVSGTIAKCGTPASWVKDAMVHHMTLVLEQVAAI